MPKVKMSDVKSGSENVKNVFRRTMDMRTLGWFKKQKYTNDELLEIMKISISIERHKDHRYLYQRLIESQTGPFNRAVFVAFRDLVFHTESLLNLIRYSEGITDEDKAKWIDYAIITSSYWFIPNFFMNGEAEKVGIDIKKPPFNLSFAKNVVRYKHKIVQGSDFSKDENKLFWDVLDSLTDAEKMQWYQDVIAQTYENTAVTILVSYPNTTPEIIEAYYKRNTNSQTRSILVMHKNTPPELRMEMYEIYKDEKFLPQEIQDIFLF